MLEKSLLITEITTSVANSSAAFIEIKNCANHILNFDSTDYYLSVQTDGGLWNDFKLEGSFCSGCVRLYANNTSSFNSIYGFNPPEVNSSVNGDGNDAYFIYYNGDHVTGSLVDAYGTVDENGIGKPWFYEGSRALRHSDVVVAFPSWSSSEWSIMAPTTSNPTPGALENELRYYNSKWYPYANSPTLLSNQVSVVAQADSAIVSENVNCTNVLILEDASLIVSAGIGITVSGDLLIRGLLKLQSNLSSSSSIMVNGHSSGTLFYERFLTGGISSPWHLISAPLKGQSIHSFLTNPANSIQTSITNNFGLAPYNSNTEMWNYFHNGFGQSPNVASVGSGNLKVALGYSILRSSTGIVEFSGTLITNDKSIELTASKWNFLGNPYPSFINANSLSGFSNIIDANSTVLKDTHKAIYFWNNTSNQYEIVNNASPATFVSPGQGFFVLADGGGGNYNFTETMQSHQSADWFERSVDYPSITIYATANSKTSSSEIKLIENSSLGFDVGYDAARFNALENEFYLFTQFADASNQEVALGLQCIPFANSTECTTIPIGLEAGSLTDVVFTFELDQIPNADSIYLKDILLDTTVVVSNQMSYGVSINSIESQTGRFFILISQNDELIEAKELVESKSFVFIQSSYLYVSKPEDVKSIMVYDSVGRLLIYDSNKPFYNLSSLPKGAYIVSVKYFYKEVFKKIILK